MNCRDPKLTVLIFNEFINNRNVDGLSGLMTDNHFFSDIVGDSHNSRSEMIKRWTEFFLRFPDYRNFFTRVDSHGNLVVAHGYAFW